MTDRKQSRSKTFAVKYGSTYPTLGSIPGQIQASGVKLSNELKEISDSGEVGDNIQGLSTLAESLEQEIVRLKNEVVINSSPESLKGYIEGTNGYALYPYKGEYRESASISNYFLRSIRED